MKAWVVLMLIAIPAWAGESRPTAAMVGASCSEAWYRTIDARVPTGDGRGHGPDVGSDEWMSVVEFKLGLRGHADLPPRGSDAWCRTIDRLVEERPAGSAAGADPAAAAAEPGPAFPCANVAAGSIEATICGDAELSALDRKLDKVYAAASAKAVDEHPPFLKVEQRGWIKGRDDCWKADDRRGCVREAYRRRIAELQARYRLVPPNGPYRFACDGRPANAVVVTFFFTDPPTLIAERGDSVALMFRQPSGSGARYQGRNASFWEHHGEALVTWGYGAPQMRCRRDP